MGLVHDLLWWLGYIKDELIDFEDEITGSIQHTAQAIVDIWEVDCGGEWVVWVKTGLIASGHAMWLLLTPSLEEIIENYLEPKPGRRGGRRGRGREREARVNRAGQRRIWFRGGIPDVDHLIADRLPGRGLSQMRQMAPGEFLLWTGINVADRVLWYWLLLEATETLTTKWYSGLMQSGRCGSIPDGTCGFRLPPRTTFLQANLWFNKLGLPDLYENNLLISNNGYIEQTLPNKRSECMALVSTLWEIVNVGGAVPVIVDLEVTVSWQAPDGTHFHAYTFTGQITCAPDGAGVAYVEGAALMEQWNGSMFQTRIHVVQASGNSTLTMTGNVAVTCRNTYIE